MSLLLQPKYINKAWKVTFWLFVIDAIAKLPLKFFQSYLTPETIDDFLIFLFIARYIAFILAVFLTGILYVKSTKRTVDKSLKLRVSTYVAAIAIAQWLFFVILLGKVFLDFFGGVGDGILSAVVIFSAVYLILPLGNGFMTKAPTNP